MRCGISIALALALVLLPAARWPIFAQGMDAPAVLRLVDVEIQNFAGVIVPCMGNDKLSIPLDSLAIVRDAANLYLPIAAQHSGVELLGAAGVLRNKDFAIDFDSKDSIEGGNYKGMGLVRDGNIVTSGACPDISRLTGYKDGTRTLVASFIGLLVQ